MDGTRVKRGVLVRSNGVNGESGVRTYVNGLVARSSRQTSDEEDTLDEKNWDHEVDGSKVEKMISLRQKVVHFSVWDGMGSLS